MSEAKGYVVTVEDAVDAGLRLGLSGRRTLQLWRAAGGRMRTREFMALWHARRALLGERRGAA